MAAVPDASLDYPGCPSTVATVLGLLIVNESLSFSDLQVCKLQLLLQLQRRCRVAIPFSRNVYTCPVWSFGPPCFVIDAFCTIVVSP